MIETCLILAFSLALFVYWFRYTVLLLLSEEPASASESGAVIGQLHVLKTREALRIESNLPLDSLHRALNDDFRMLRYLLDNAAGMGLRPFERCLLLFDYRLMSAWYRITKKASASRARRALEEMTSVLSHIAYKMGERTLSLSEA